MWEGSRKYFLLEKNLRVCNSAWLEYLSDTQEVGGSSPSAPTNTPIRANWLGSRHHELEAEICVRVSLGVQKRKNF